MKLYVHLNGLFPKLSDVVQLYGTIQFFEKEYGVDKFGNLTADHKKVADGDEEQEDARIVRTLIVMAPPPHTSRVVY